MSGGMDETGGERTEDVHPRVLVNENPLTGTFYTVVEFLQSYGWILLFVLVVCLYLKSKLSPTVQKYKRKVEKTIEQKKFDPEKARSQMEKMEAARQRLQEQYSADAARHMEKVKQKEEEKRQQKIDDWEGHLQGKGYRSKFKPKEEDDTVDTNKVKPKKPIKDTDYSPLMGDSGASCSWRPGQRRGGGG